MVRGSRKHVLDWTSQREFATELLRTVAPAPVRLMPDSIWMPNGYGSPGEARLETFGPKVLSSVDWTRLRAWWLVHEAGANTPNWDIAASCEIEGRPGLILVEAKANVPELSSLGKPAASTASAASRENHEHIGAAIAEACDALGQLGIATRINRDSHYQLSNRLAFTWKLASLGVPTVLMYLGFIGDAGIVDAGEPIASAQHWDSVFAAYASTIVPESLFERRIDCGQAPMWCLLRSKEVIEVSPPRALRQTPS